MITDRITDHGRGMTADPIANLGAYVPFERSIQATHSSDPFERHFYAQQGSGMNSTDRDWASPWQSVC